MALILLIRVMISVQVYLIVYLTHFSVNLRLAVSVNLITASLLQTSPATVKGKKERMVAVRLKTKKGISSGYESLQSAIILPIPKIRLRQISWWNSAVRSPKRRNTDNIMSHVSEQLKEVIATAQRGAGLMSPANCISNIGNKKYKLPVNRRRLRSKELNIRKRIRCWRKGGFLSPLLLCVGGSALRLNSQSRR